MAKITFLIILELMISKMSFSQHFYMCPPDLFSKTKPLTFGEILKTSRSSILIASSVEICEFDGIQMYLGNGIGNGLKDKNGNLLYLGKNSNLSRDYFELKAGIKFICEGPEKIMYFVSLNNNFGVLDYNIVMSVISAPFNSEIQGKKIIPTKIFIDKKGTLFIATNSDIIYYVDNATKLLGVNSQDSKFYFEQGLDRDSNFVVIKGARDVKQFTLGKDIIPFSFGVSPDNDKIIIIGTNNGLYKYEKETGKSDNLLKSITDTKFTITQFEVDKSEVIFWFSTLEKGMAKFNRFTNSLLFFKYPKIHSNKNTLYPIRSFSRKSAKEFFVSVGDSLPAVFNVESNAYTFINDTVFYKTANQTSDIEADGLGNLFISKGGGLFFTSSWLQQNSQSENVDSSLFGPYITAIMLNRDNYDSKYVLEGTYEALKEINLKYNENNIFIEYSCRGISSDSLIVAWKLDNYSSDWLESPNSIIDNRLASISDLRPGKYIFRIKAKSGKKDWLPREARLVINIANPYWLTWWFWASITAALCALIFIIVKWRVIAVRKEERQKAQHEKELLELEARALRAQMNPHFIFNCLNSIKSIIQKDKKDEAVNYLVTFSKLIRTIFQNSDKREISLFDEIETCRLYTELESLRFGNKLFFSFLVDETIDLKSVMVPALIIQPFIENAIWHGLIPKETGGNLTVTLTRKQEEVYCVVEDNGIGRTVSLQNKSRDANASHESQGVRLT